MGFFKKKVTPAEFGEGVVVTASSWIGADAGRSLGMRFENFDGSRGWGQFLESRGVPAAALKLYVRLFSHCALQAAFTKFGEDTRRRMTEGAIAAYADKIAEYDFGKTYAALEAVYSGEHTFDPKLETLGNSEAQLDFLPNGNVGVLNAKYLIESFVVTQLQNSGAFFTDFASYSSTCFAAVGTVRRAMDHIFSSYKLS